MKARKSIVEVAQKELPEFVAEVDGLSQEALNSRLAELAKGLAAIQTAKEDDEELEEAKEKASELAAPYRDGVKALTLKSRYIISLLSDKGAT